MSRVFCCYLSVFLSLAVMCVMASRSTRSKSLALILPHTPPPSSSVGTASLTNSTTSWRSASRKTPYPNCQERSTYLVARTAKRCDRLVPHATLLVIYSWTSDLIWLPPFNRHQRKDKWHSQSTCAIYSVSALTSVSLMLSTRSSTVSLGTSRTSGR